MTISVVDKADFRTEVIGMVHFLPQDSDIDLQSIQVLISFLDYWY